jgi:tRNA/rRNA methyltransferase
MKQPVIILVRPQLGDNIGAVARVMGNFGLPELRLVAPRDGWPNPRAEKSAVNAIGIVQKAKIYPTTAEAVEGIQHLYATTLRDRDMTKDVDSPKEAASQLEGWIREGTRPGILFGPERTGLENEDIGLSDKILTIPTVAKHGSMNLSHAVAVVAYEWYGLMAAKKMPKIKENQEIAEKKEIIKLLEHMDEELLAADHYKNPTMRPRMQKNLHNIFQRLDLTGQEVRTLHGVIRTLAEGPKRK